MYKLIINDLNQWVFEKLETCWEQVKYFQEECPSTQIYSIVIEKGEKK